MDSGECQYLFKETRLNLEPSSSALVANIRVPAPSSSHARGANSQSSSHDGKALDEETAFALKNLSPASSIYQRQWAASPSSFLWRVLEDGMVLSVRAVDACKQQKDLDAPLVLNFKFTVPILPSCVALTDPQDHDALFIYVIDQSNHLYSFSLRPDIFRRRATLDSNITDVCRVHLPPSLTSRHPHRLVVATPDQLLVTLHDGGLVKLDRNRGADSTTNPWTEASYNSQTWTQGLRNLLPIRAGNTVKFGKIHMDYSAAASAQVSSLGLGEASFLFTVCIDHRMRIWNIETGQILRTIDILNREHNPQEMGKWTIDPSQANLIRIIETGPGQALCVTFSPIGPGEFKFWKVLAKTDSSISLEDAFPNDHFVPNAPSLSDAWTLTDFNVSEPDESGMHVWMLWKNNTTYRVQRLQLTLTDMAGSWEAGCDAVYFDSSLPTAETSGPCDPTDATEKWLQVILSPGRFTKATLETALALYERGLGKSGKAFSKGVSSLPEAICSVLASTATLDRSQPGGMDYEQFRSSSELHWRRFYRLVMELDKRRGEAVSLVLDSNSGTTWVVCADFVSAIRDCSPLEKLYHNLSTPDDDEKDAATLISTALTFLDVLPDNILQVCKSVLRPELFEDTTKTDLERLQYFSDKAAFWRGLTEEDCTPVVDYLGQNFSLLSSDLYEQIFDLVTAEDSAGRSIRHPLTEFGRKLAVKAVQDSLELQWKVCFSQLILLAHMEFEFEQEEDALHHRLDVGAIFRRLVDVLRRLELLRWLSKTEITVPLRTDRSGSISGGSPSASRKEGEETQVITALEGSVGHLLGFGDAKREPLASSLTGIVANLCSLDSDVEVSPAHIQCFLIKRNRADLALELMPFSDLNPFSTYVQGRVFLAMKDLPAAAIQFRKAAIGLSAEDAKTDRHSVGLLDDTEWNLLHQGMAKYYCHVVTLFERQRAYSYVLEFSRLALQFAHAASSDANLVRTEMLSRQFNASVALSHFDAAHSALLAMDDHALQQSSLRKLVDRMCESCHNTELTSLPFANLATAVDDILAQKCRSVVDVSRGVPYHQILYSWRITRNDYRGAASVLLDRIQKLRAAGEGDKLVGEDVLDTPVTRHYLLLINALSCVDPKQAWVFSEGFGADGVDGARAGKRRVVTLADVRKEYQEELDRIAAIQNNQFGFEAEDAMDIA